MKIAIDTIPLLSPLTGIGYYTLKIAQALRAVAPQHQYFYYYGYFSPRLLFPPAAPGAVSRLKDWLLDLPALKKAARSLKGLGNYASFRNFDLYFEPNFIPLKIPAERLAVTVADFSFARFPQWHTAEKVRYFEKHFWEKAREADAVIVLSDFVKREAIAHFGMAEKRLFTVPLGVDPRIFRKFSPSELRAVRERHRLPDRFLLFVGAIEPRKNLPRLLRAYKKLPATLRKNCPLILSGAKGWKNEEVMDSLRRSGGEVRFLGYVPEGELGPLYGAARVLVYPSLYEGFGLPPLEAMACGCPVVVAETASLPEICGDAAVYVDPLDEERIAAGIRGVLEDEACREELIRKGTARAARFTWERSAREHLRVFTGSRSKKTPSPGDGRGEG
jgi:glycosyltransferase involved in cell wall biosynthesis